MMRPPVAILFLALCFVSFITVYYSLRINSPLIRRSCISMNLDSSILSIAAGSAAGAVGVLAAYPFDSLKTKAQTFQGDRSLGLMEMVKIVMKEEGVSGFYNGVAAVMLGQAFIKAAAFGSNNWALTIQGSHHYSILELTLAASFSGFVTSFLVNPVERVKILMQADSKGKFSSEIDCAGQILANDGFNGLFFRGIDATILREVPGYALYFVMYSQLSDLTASTLGPTAPLFCGAAAGCMSWLPVYPIDVVKTNMQNTQGSGSNQQTQSMSSSSSDSSAFGQTMLSTALELAKRGGLSAFYDGITPKLIRASINHSVTFFVYDFLINKFLPIAN